VFEKLKYSEVHSDNIKKKNKKDTFGTRDKSGV